MMRPPNILPILSPEPTIPVVAAPVPMNLAALLISSEMVLLWKLQLRTSEVRGFGAAKLLNLLSVGISGLISTTADTDLLSNWEDLLNKLGRRKILVQADIFRG